LQNFSSSGSAKYVSSSVAFANGLFGYAPPTRFISRIDSTVEYFFDDDLFEVNFNDAGQQVFPHHDFWNGPASARQLPNERARYKFHLGLIKTADLLDSLELQCSDEQPMNLISTEPTMIF
jgi:hypothetical protein